MSQSYCRISYVTKKVRCIKKKNNKHVQKFVVLRSEAFGLRLSKFFINKMPVALTLILLKC